MASLALIETPAPSVKSWLVKHQNGAVISVMELRLSDKHHSDLGYIIVEAETEEEAQAKAKKKVYNTYCARKKTEAKRRHYERGECACGRPQDRYKKSGEIFKTCSVCSARQPAYNEKYKGRVQSGTVGKEPRDEKARITKNLERQRDRKKEMRVTVLIEVRKKFWDTKHMRDFAKWLDDSIEEAL